MMYITSLNNSEIKHVVKLQDAKYRKKYNSCIIEGLRTITTALECGLELKKLFVTKEQLGKISHLVAQENIVLVSSQVMEKLSTTVTPSGILAIFSIPLPPSANLLTAGLILARVSDPGNMGTLIRTAVACGIKSIVTIEGADPWSSKVIQASAGTIACANIFQWSWETVIKEKKDLKLYSMVVESGKPINTIDTSKSLLIVGNESYGIPIEWQKQSDELISLPMPGNTESLNAAVAGSIALYIIHVYTNP